MGSSFFETRALAARGAVVITRDDTPVMIRMRYVGTGTVTSVTMTTATNLVNITSDGGTDTYAFATYNTVGKLIAAINADGVFEAVALDSLLSDVTSSSNIVENTAITAGTDGNGVVVWDLHADTSVNKFATATLSLHRDFNTLGKGHRVHLQEIVYNEDINAASANGVRVYQRVGGVETQLVGYASVDVTKTTINWASGQGKITGADNADIIVRVIDGTSLTDATANFISASGIYE